jgi:hypothetical protein
VYQGSPGILEIPGRARGRLESWDKWSFPGGPVGQGDAELPGWRPVRKLIRRFGLASGQDGARVQEPGPQAGCEVELTEVRVPGQSLWTLGFEATGPVSLLPRHLEATAAHVFAQALPSGAELGTDDSPSYAQWLSGGQQPSG